MKSQGWNEGLTEVCANFQVDISCLIDAELDEAAAGRAMVHMEACECCRRFFDDTREHTRLHRDISDPSRLVARFAMLTGGSVVAAVESIDLVHRLASIFYQLGKAYVLAGIDPGYRERVFEAVVPVDSTHSRGRGFVDGVLMNGKGDTGGLDWQRARAMLNGRLEKIQSPIEKDGACSRNRSRSILLTRSRSSTSRSSTGTRASASPPPSPTGRSSTRRSASRTAGTPRSSSVGSTPPRRATRRLSPAGVGSRSVASPTATIGSSSPGSTWEWSSP